MIYFDIFQQATFREKDRKPQLQFKDLTYGIIADEVIGFLESKNIDPENDKYITCFYKADNIYEIIYYEIQEGTLKGYGINQCGQLGDGTAKPVRSERYREDSNPYSSEPFKLMEKIKDVRFDNFTVYATTFSGDLFILGKGYSAHPSKIENWY